MGDGREQGRRFSRLGTRRFVLSTVLWAAAWITYEAYGPELPLLADLAVIFGAMPIGASFAAIFIVRGYVSRSKLPIDRGFTAGATVSLSEDISTEKRRSVELFLLTAGASSESVHEADFRTGLRLFVNVSPSEVQDIVDMFERKEISLAVDFPTEES